MPICFERKIAFIHIPKTGGRSFEEILGVRHEKNFFSTTTTYTFEGVTYAPQHLPPRLLKPMVPDFDELTTVCFTRHPYTRAVSEYFWYFKQQHPEKTPLEKFDEEVFKNWVATELSKKNSDHKIDQYVYFKDCEHAFQMETMSGHRDEIGQALGISITEPLPHRNRNEHDTGKIAASLSDEIHSAIRELYPNDFEELGYS